MNCLARYYERNFLLMPNMKYKYCLILVTLLMTPAFGQEMLLPPPGLNALSTRETSEYISREQALMSLIENQENQEYPLLAEDFEAWSAKSKQWLPKTKWLETVRRQTNFSIHNLSVRHLDDLVIVSFSLKSISTLQEAQLTQFIVDVWRKSTNKLTIRYTSDVTEKSDFETKD